jgi:hypothetical protein
MAKLFIRDWTVIVGQRGKKGRRIKGLRTIFKINKNSSSSSNKSVISVYNLSESTLSLIQENTSKNDAFIQLESGYIGSKLGVIYSGDIKSMDFKSSNGDLITTFEAGDGQVSLEKAHLDKSYAVGTNINVIVNDLLKTLKDSGNVIINEFKSNNTTIEQIGLTVAGMTKDALDNIFGKLGLTWSIQNNQVRIIEKGKSTNETRVVLTPETGLIGRTMRTESGVKFRSLINTFLLNPGTQVHIKSPKSKIDEIFVMNNMAITGDTHGQAWYIDGEATKL